MTLRKRSYGEAEYRKKFHAAVKKARLSKRDFEGYLEDAFHGIDMPARTMFKKGDAYYMIKAATKSKEKSQRKSRSEPWFTTADASFAIEVDGNEVIISAGMYGEHDDFDSSERVPLDKFVQNPKQIIERTVKKLYRDMGPFGMREQADMNDPGMYGMDARTRKRLRVKKLMKGIGKSKLRRPKNTAMKFRSTHLPELEGD